MSRFFVSATFLVVLYSCRNDTIDFSAEVKPIINKHCISCHGGVKRNGGFSLLFRQDALEVNESGKRAIVPGDPDHSEMIRRLLSSDPEERMPYREEPLSKEEINILTRWIKQGAEWGDHWAYVPPKKIPLPKLSANESWPQNGIDHFILDKLNKEKISPSPKADRPTLLRRLYLDLIGLPPTTDQVEKFVPDESPDALGKIVDELLASPRFGEKWASWWLDMARYSDTRGYERDASRSIWRYRDWVIRALNEDMPFDQFTIEQLAGDLLPAPDDDQFIATAFHRNTMNNDEGGTEDEEFRVASVIDRVNTTMDVWQSTTFGCVQCHSHPYDPFRHEEYYKVMAFFNNSRDEDTEGEHPNLRTYTPEDQANLERIKVWVRQYDEKKEEEIHLFLKTQEPKHHPHDCDLFVNGELIDTKWLGIRPGGSARLRNVNLTGKTRMILRYWTGFNNGVLEIRKDRVDGELIARKNLDNTQGKRLTIQVPIKAVNGKADIYFVLNNPSIRADQSVCAIEWFAFRDDLPGEKSSKEYTEMSNTFMHLLNAKVENTPVMVENNKNQFRPTFIFERGNWLVPGEEVTSSVPSHLNALPDDQPANRLGLARWLVSHENPLTARTMVNRLWEQLFGLGIVETIEDFGTQGALPSHPELLDWLALRFMNDHGWSIKKMLKEMVMSATYQQDSRVSQDLLEWDPSNRFLARGPRVRLSAEQVRDQVLAVSDLLSYKMYGPGVMPYQPEGVWQTVYSNEYWKLSEGEDRNRRAVYTFLKRTSPYPSFMMFDASSREVCLVRRIRTNTPLQALVTLNDPVYVDAARGLAKKVMSTATTPAERIKEGYYTALLRDVSDSKLAILLQLYEEALKKYEHDSEATKLLTQAEEADPAMAAMIVVANAILNLDEFVTKG